MNWQCISKCQNKENDDNTIGDVLNYFFKEKNSVV